MTQSGQLDVVELKAMGGEVMVAGDADEFKLIIAVELRLGKSRHC